MNDILRESNSYESSDGDVLPYADIEEPIIIEPELEDSVEVAPVTSEGFIAAQRIIEDGIAQSKEHGYTELKVDFWVPEKKNPNGGYQSRMPLSQFFGGNALRKMVTTEEYDALFAKYGYEISRYSEDHIRKIGGGATRAAEPTIESGHRHYRDPQSAAAGDYLDED